MSWNDGTLLLFPPTPPSAPFFLQDITAKMEAELQHGLAMCEAEVMAFIEPLEQVRFGAVLDAVSKARRPRGVAASLYTASQTNPHPTPPALPLQLTVAEVRRLEAAEAGRADLVGSLDRLKQRVANVE